MTTIAYNHKDKQIACDSRTTNNGVITSDKTNKMQIINGVRFWFTGVVADQRKFTAMYFGEKCGDYTPECNAYAYDGELLYCGVTNEGELWKEPVLCDHSSGSGGNFALSGLLMGMTAKQAVAHAMQLDIYSGGKIRVFDVK